MREVKSSTLAVFSDCEELVPFLPSGVAQGIKTVFEHLTVPLVALTKIPSGFRVLNHGFGTGTVASPAGPWDAEVPQRRKELLSVKEHYPYQHQSQAEKEYSDSFREKSIRSSRFIGPVMQAPSGASMSGGKHA